MQQYADYMLRIVRGDMGKSFITGKPIVSEILSRMPTTFILAFAGVLVAVLIGIPLGIISATKQYSLLDNISTLFALTGVAMPNFWLGLMLILVFSLHLGWLPSGGADTWQGYILPAITLGVGATANFMRTTRSSMLEVIRQDYVRTVRAKGANERIVIIGHALRNALIPVVTVIGLQIGTLLGGAVINETVFSLPGIGMYMINSINKKDEPAVLGCLITFAVVFSLINLLVDAVTGTRSASSPFITALKRSRLVQDILLTNLSLKNLSARDARLNTYNSYMLYINYNIMHFAQNVNI